MISQSSLSIDNYKGDSDFSNGTKLISIDQSISLFKNITRSLVANILSIRRAFSQHSFENKKFLGIITKSLIQSTFNPEYEARAFTERFEESVIKSWNNNTLKEFVLGFALNPIKPSILSEGFTFVYKTCLKNDNSISRISITNDYIRILQNLIEYLVSTDSLPEERHLILKTIFNSESIQKNYNDNYYLINNNASISAKESNIEVSINELKEKSLSCFEQDHNINLYKTSQIENSCLQATNRNDSLSLMINYRQNLINSLSKNLEIKAKQDEEISQISLGTVTTPYHTLEIFISATKKVVSI